MFWGHQVIGRAGNWLKDAMYKSYLMFFSPEGLLAAGNWPGATKKEFDMHFWHPRFLIDVPPSLIRVVFPFLGKIQLCIAKFHHTRVQSPIAKSAMFWNISLLLFRLFGKSFFT